MNQLENSRWNGTDDYLNFLVENCSALLSNRSEFDDGSSNSSLESEENPSYFSRDYRIVGTFFQGLILLVGVLGNLLVVLVHIHASLCSNRNIVHSRPEKAPSFSSCPYFRQHLISLLPFALFYAQKVVYRTRSMHSPTNCYLVSLAAADCVVLIASVPNEILSYYVIGSQWIWGSVGCAIFVFLQNLGIMEKSADVGA